MGDVPTLLHKLLAPLARPVAPLLFYEAHGCVG